MPVLKYEADVGASSLAVNAGREYTPYAPALSEIISLYLIESLVENRATEKTGIRTLFASECCFI